MNKLEKFNSENLKIEKSKMANVIGGTSTTSYKEACFAPENEYPEDENGCPDYGKVPTLVDLPL
jgi:hypothetical protein